MKINYNVEIPMSDADDVNAVYQFANGDKKNMEITYDDKHEAIKRRGVLARAIENNELPMSVKRIANKVYIEKK